VVFALIGGKKYGASILIATIVGGGFYVLITVAMVKMGWVPATLRRPARGATGSARRARSSSSSKRTSADGGSGAAAAEAPRAKPAPTKRTNASNPRTRKR
jgi:hypothetical protein